MEGQTEEILATELLDRIEGEDVTIDDLLALLAFALHEDIQPLMQAREKGAQIGAVNTSAYALKERARTALC